MMSLTGRFAGGVSPSRQRGAKRERELSTEELDELALIFKCDVNGDGLAKPELKEALWLLDQHASEEEMDSILVEYGKDHARTLDLDEFKLLIKTRLTYENTRQEYEEAFRAIDRNKDGHVDITELNRLMVAAGFGLEGTELSDIFSGFDQDGSGKIDLKEFLDYMKV